MPGQRSRQRRALHFFGDGQGRRKPRAAFDTEPEAQSAAHRVFALTGRRYSAYRCHFSTCDAWHIRPCALRPGDLARPA